MKQILMTLLVAVAIISCQSKAEKQNNTTYTKKKIMITEEKEAIEKVIKNYFNSLNNSSVTEAVAQYSANGVFMPKDAPTSIGPEQLTMAYEHIFKNLDFINMGFTIDELTVDNSLAIVRTSSLGNLKILANNVAVEGAEHRELFVMEKKNGEWKIARYMFNTTEAVKH